MSSIYSTQSTIYSTSAISKRDKTRWTSSGATTKSSSYSYVASPHRLRARALGIELDSEIWSVGNTSNDNDDDSANNKIASSTDDERSEDHIINNDDDDWSNNEASTNSGISCGSGSSSRVVSENSPHGVDQYQDENYKWSRPMIDGLGTRGVYTGEFCTSRRMPHGKGRMEYDDDQGMEWYEGDWIDGKWAGIGSYSNGQGDLYQGGWKNHLKHGKGTMEFADGSVFEGDYLSDQMIHGKMEYDDGAFYNGSWFDGKSHGRGQLVYLDDSEYYGEFREGVFHGHGKMTWSDGGFYVGEWYQGEKHGRGKQIHADGTVDHNGDWVDGHAINKLVNKEEGDDAEQQVERVSTNSVKDTTLYSFLADGKRGECITEFADGRVFEGEYADGEMRKGKMTYPDGRIFHGSWVNANLGTCLFTDGSEYDGEFRGGNLHGHGKLIFGNGGYYVGEWRDGEKHGLGKEIRANGSLHHDGEWLHGQPIVNGESSIGQIQGPSQDDSAHTPCSDTERQTDGSNQTSPKMKTLRASTNRFFSTLRAYLSCRKTMETAFLQDREMFSIATIKANDESGGIEVDSEKSNEYKPEFQQQSVDGRPVRSLDELYEAANVAMPTFQALVNNLAAKACTTSSTEDSQEDVDTHRQPPSIVIGTKGRDRAQEKATNDYSSREPGPAVSWLYDIVRASIEFQSAKEVKRCIRLLLEGDEYFIVKAKNRFMKPTLTGYRDFSVWIQIECQDGFKHICEIQIHHARMKQLDSDLGSHNLYEFFRAFFAGATDCLADRLQDLEMISEGYQLDDFSLETFVKDCVDEDRLERLASLFHEQMCEFDLALEAYQKLLQLRQIEYGMDHIAIAKTYDSQAAVYRHMGQLDRAMELYGMGCKIYEGTSEMSLAVSLQHMAIIKAERGFPNVALSLYERSFDVVSGIPGNVELFLADIYNNMGNAKRDLGFLDSAMALHEESMRIKKRYLGEEHSSISTSYNNMGLVRLKQGMIEDAISCFLDAIRVDQRALGSEHVSVAVIQANLGLAYERNRELEAAKEMYGLALTKQRSILGEDHEDVVWTIENLARVHVREKNFDKAIELLEESLTIKLESYDADHTEVIRTSEMLDSVRRKKSRGEADIETVEHSNRGGGRERLSRLAMF